MPAIKKPMTGEAAPDRQAHWQQVYGKKSETEVSWFEARPDLSVALMEAAGGGAARLSRAASEIGGGVPAQAGALSWGGPRAGEAREPRGGGVGAAARPPPPPGA